MKHFAVKIAVTVSFVAAALSALSAYAEAPDVIYSNGVRSSSAEDIEPLSIRGINVDLGAGTVDFLDAARIVSFMNDDASVNSDRLWEYVSGLAAAYNTYDSSNPRTITNHAGEEKTIRSYYGWALDGDATFSSLSAMLSRVAAESNLASLLKPKGPGASATLKDILSVETDPADAYTVAAGWSRRGASHEGADYGGTYVEVDMGRQRVYVYQNYTLVIDTACVTGMMTAERKTPEGIYSIYNKETNKVLTGYLPDGSVDYESPVTYWMPFNGGIGLHDATWRSNFGGSIYVNSGSHGCINLPYSAAETLYGIAYIGMPVICYY